MDFCGRWFKVCKSFNILCKRIEKTAQGYVVSCEDGVGREVNAEEDSFLRPLGVKMK